ncbi:MAG: LytTR family transcriptional regulator DNA-binding domain-containing protein [Bacteroidales bacterium]|nr:LytTR family transcriptional regulator DNA-binding domain-containing protein [Bacteroidales bacterium]MCB8999882.1 LytTR family transcriptional regulator DNA-binding domain-containing protein [Bacteroidales bacterium]
MIRTIIIDDEPLARSLLADYINDLEDIEIVAQCADGFSGLKAIQEHEPDLIFLDIQMPKLTGFEMLELLDKKPEIIFSTAFDQFAIKAFELNAVDYLLKPFSFERFKESIEKAINRINNLPDKALNNSSIEKLREHIDDSEGILNRIVVKTRNTIVVLPVQQINYIEAQDDYVMIYLNGARYLKQKTLSYYEEHLDNRDFLRVHRSYIVRIDQIQKIEPWEKSSFILILKGGEKVPISRSGYTRLKEKLDY